MQYSRCLGAGLLGSLDVACREAGRFSHFQAILELSNRCSQVRDGGVSLAACARLAVGRLSRGFDRALVGIDRARQGQTVVALLHGFVSLTHGCGCRAERLRRVLLGAGGACCVDRTLGSIDFFLGRLRARSGEEERAERDNGATHCPEV